MTEAVPLQAELDLLLEAANAAAKTALSFFRNNAKVWTKGGNSPVSEADIAVDEELREHLLGARPDYGYLSEETDDDGSRLTATRTFVVDPIDGTRAFVADATDWTIPLALVEAGRPIAAVLLAPARGESFQATVGGGAFRDGNQIRVSDRREIEGAVLGVSRRLLNAASASPINAKAVFHASLAYRLARVADGRSDGAAIKANAQDWDLAAADLVVHEAGGRLSYLDGAVARYDRPDTRHGPMVAGSASLCPHLARLMEAAIADGL